MKRLLTHLTIVHSIYPNVEKDFSKTSVRHLGPVSSKDVDGDPGSDHYVVSISYKTSLVKCMRVLI